MSRRIRVRGAQKEEIELERLAHALLKAAREAARQRETQDAKAAQENGDAA